MRAPLLIGLLAGFAASPAVAVRARRVQRPPAQVKGRVTVTYVTQDTAFLDRGSEDGLSVGQPLALERNGRSAGKCTVRAVSARSAACEGPSVRVGDSAKVKSSSARGTTEPPLLPKPPPAAALKQQRAIVLEAPPPFVSAPETDGSALALTGLRAEAELEHQSFAFAEVADSFHQERVSLALRGLPVAAGARLYLDAAAIQWTRRPEGFLSPHRSASQLFLRELALTRREEGGFVFSAGRVWPYRAAGLGLLDGAQLGWASEDRSVEAGVFAGAIPRALNLAPDVSRPVLGAYGAYTHAGKGGPLSWLQQELHLSVAPGGEGARVGLESVTRAWFDPLLDVGVDVRLAQGGPRGTSPRVEAARAMLGLRPFRTLRADAAVRFDDSFVEALPSVVALPLEHRAVHADASIRWEPASWFCLAGAAGQARDFEAAAQRAWVGGEVCAPRLLAGAVALSAGYQEDLGWSRGRSLWGMVLLRPSPRWELLARSTWQMLRHGAGRHDWWERQLGGYASLRYSVSRTFSFRAAGLFRLGLAGEEEEGGRAPLGVAANASLAASF